jgi:hypothetical protein
MFAFYFANRSALDVAKTHVIAKHGVRCRFSKLFLLDDRFFRSFRRGDATEIDMSAGRWWSGWSCVRVVRRVTNYYREKGAIKEEGKKILKKKK